MTTPIIIGIVIVVLLSGLRIAREYERGVIFRLGRYIGLRGPGLYWIIPLGIERSVRIDIRTRTVSAEQQETITRDSVTVKVNAVLWYHVTDAAKSVVVCLRTASSNSDRADFSRKRVSTMPSALTSVTVMVAISNTLSGKPKPSKPDSSSWR